MGPLLMSGMGAPQRRVQTCCTPSGLGKRREGERKERERNGGMEKEKEGRRGGESENEREKEERNGGREREMEGERER